MIYSLEECKRVNPVKNVPCRITNTWTPSSPCSSYLINFFNSTGDFLGEANLSSYGVTCLCNASFNYSVIGSYTFNMSTGDTGQVIVEDEGSMVIAMIILLPMLLSFILLVIAASLSSEEHNA